MLFLLFDLMEFCDDLMDSGTPFHLELTFGTVGGSFCGTAENGWPPFAAVCFRWASANCSRALCEGSFSVRKLRTPFFFFFVDDDLDSRDTEPSEDARLMDPDDVMLLASGSSVNFGVDGGVGNWREPNVSLDSYVVDEILELMEESSAAGSGFL